MNLKVECIPEYFELLKNGKRHEFRQFEDITIINTETGEERKYEVDKVFPLDDGRARTVMENFNLVSWNPNRPIYAIGLGGRIRQPVQAGVRPTGIIEEGGKFEFYKIDRRVQT